MVPPLSSIPSPVPACGQSRYPSVPRQLQFPDMNTSVVIGASARPRAAYSATLNLPGRANLIQAIHWSAELLPQLYEYRAEYARGQFFRNRFSATAYRMVTEQVAELETALARSATGQPELRQQISPVGPNAATPVLPHLTVPGQIPRGALGAASGPPRSAPAAGCSAMSAAGSPYPSGHPLHYSPYSL